MLQIISFLSAYYGSVQNLQLYDCENKNYLYVLCSGGQGQFLSCTYFHRWCIYAFSSGPHGEPFSHDCSYLLSSRSFHIYGIAHAPLNAPFSCAFLKPWVSLTWNHIGHSQNMCASVACGPWGAPQFGIYGCIGHSWTCLWLYHLCVFACVFGMPFHSGKQHHIYCN